MVEPARDLLTLVRGAAKRCRGTPWLVAQDGTWTLADFAAEVEREAAAWRAAGLQPGDRVVVLLPRSGQEVRVLLAVAAAGGLVVPLHARLKDDQITHVLADCEPFAVVTEPSRLLALQDPVRTLDGQRVFGPAGGAWPVPVVALPQPAGNGTHALPTPDPQQGAMLLYTSGSTGRAKGIVQSHHNLCLGAALVAGYLGLGPDDHVLALLPFSFDYGWNQLLTALHTGCRITAADPLGGGELAQLLRTHRPTGLAGVPAMWHEVAAALAHGTLTAADGHSLRYVTNSGGALRPSDAQGLRQHWPHVQVFAMYGLTEAFRSAFLPPAEFDAHPESFGRALPGVELLLVGQDGEVLDGPATGELVHAGALVALGYWRRPADDALRFRPDPRGRPGRVVHSGDIVRRDERGLHYFVGRSDRLLKVHGHRVSPDEVALAVAGMPGVGEVAVFGQDGEAAGHRIVLCCSGDPDQPELRASIQRRCRARLPSYMQPAVVVVLAELPHNQNGKVDEAALRERVRACTDAT